MKILKFMFLAALFTMCTGLASAQTVNHAYASSQGTSVKISWANPQVSGDAIIVGVQPPGGTLTDLAGDTFTQDYASGNQAVFHASPITAFTGNVLTYIPPSGATNVVVSANEQTETSQITFDAGGNGSGSGAVVLVPNTPTASGDLVYAMLSSGQCCSGTVVSGGMVFVNGEADTWWGANTYSGWSIDAIGIPTTQGVIFTYSPGLGGGSGSGIMAAYRIGPPPPPPVQNTVAVSISATYEDGTIPTILSIGVQDVTKNPVTLLTLTPDPTTGTASGSINLTSTETYEVILYVSGGQVGQTYYQADLVQSLMPNISQANFSVVLCKTTCLSGAIKSFSSGAQ
jgi:hypothetical protein